MSRLLSDHLDGWVAAHVAKVFPQALSPTPNSGPGSLFPVGLSRGMAGIHWWRAKVWRLHIDFSGTKIVNGVTDHGDPWSYTVTYSGALDTTFDIGNIELQGYPNSGVYQDAISSIGIGWGEQWFERAFGKTVAGPLAEYEWDFDPPEDAPELPEDETIFMSVGFGVTVDSTSTAQPDFRPRVVESDGQFFPTLLVGISGVGESIKSALNDTETIELEYQDIGGGSLGALQLYNEAVGTPLPFEAEGYLKLEELWPAEPA